ncbi:DNA polymerase [Persephonella sp.]
MWAIASKDFSKYKLTTRETEKEYSRIDFLINALKPCSHVFVYNKGDFEPIARDYGYTGKIVALEDILPQRLTIPEVKQLFLQLEELGFHLEIAGLGSLAAQLIFGLPENIRKLSRKEADIAEQAFYGGRVENLVREYSSKEASIVYYDISSAYPYLLAEALLPATWGERQEFTDLTVGQLRMLFKTGLTGVAYIDVIDEGYIPILPVRSGSGEVFFPSGRKEGWYHLPEVLMFPDNTPVKEAVLYPKTESPFKAPIYTMYEKRQQVKTYYLKKMLKVILTALWGVVSRKGTVGNRMIGGYITSLQRVRLLKAINRLIEAGFKVLYYDTDGIVVDVFDRRKEADLIVGVSEGVFGGWEVRYEGITRIEVGGVKQYQLEFEDGTTKIAWKGVPVSLSAENINVKEGKIEYEVFSQWTGKRQRVVYEAKPVPKRRFLSDEYSVPFSVDEINEAGGKEYACRQA